MSSFQCSLYDLNHFIQLGLFNAIQVRPYKQEILFTQTLNIEHRISGGLSHLSIYNRWTRTKSAHFHWRAHYDWGNYSPNGLTLFWDVHRRSVRFGEVFLASDKN